MITLKTLPQATAQEVFDFVSKNLLEQNKKSQNDIGTCQYRGKDNTKCAAGFLIADDEIGGIIERNNNSAWSSLINMKLVPDAHQYLIASLQSVHDNRAPSSWRDELMNVARINNIIVNF